MILKQSSDPKVVMVVSHRKKRCRRHQVHPMFLRKNNLKIDGFFKTDLYLASKSLNRKCKTGESKVYIHTKIPEKISVKKEV